MRGRALSLVKGACTQTLRSHLTYTPILSYRKPGQHARLLHNSVIKSRSDPEPREYIYESMYEQLPLPQAPLPSSVFTNVNKWSHKVAIECGLTGRSYTYGKLYDLIWRWGGYLEKTFGRESGVTVGILSPNTPEYPIVFFGTIAAGCITTTINSAYRPGEIASQLSDSGANILVVESMLEPQVDAALQILKKNIPVIVNGPSDSGRPNLQDIIMDNNIPYASDMEYIPDRIAVLPYSSGTTGKPKGVKITHSAINAGECMYHYPEITNVEKAEGDHQEVMMGLLPFFHLYGMMVFLVSGLNVGAKIVTLPNFDPGTFVDLVKQEKFTLLHTVPPLLHFIASFPGVSPEDLSHTHTVMCGAAPVPVGVANTIKEKFGNHLRFMEAFAMTETLCTHMTPKKGDKLGYCGKLVPYASAKIIDLNTGVSLPPGAKGELCIKAPSLMAGYHNNPEATKETIDEDGWLHTGDVATCDEDGYFAIIDRIKELIKVKGLQVAPSELEEIILDHPDVADVGVIGIKNDRTGELPMAFVVPRTKDLTEKDIMNFVEPKVARHKKLGGGVKFVQELPKTASGKLLRRELKVLAESE